MAKQLKFTFKDKEYVLEFTRRTVTEMEKKGFVAAEVENKPMSTLPAAELLSKRHILTLQRSSMSTNRASTMFGKLLSQTQSSM